MDNSEAKLILSAYRPDGQEALDPRMREALEQAKRDPELGKWLEEQQTFDRAVCDKLKCCCVPQDLKASILAGCKASSHTRSFQRYGIWALAACLLIIAGVSVLLQPDSTAKPSLSEYRDEIARQAEAMIKSGIELDFQSAEPNQVYQWVHDKKMAQTGIFTPGVARAKTFGCKGLQWRGHKVAMVCFRSPDGQVAHLFVLDRNLVSVPERKCKEITMASSLPTVSWFDETNAYVLVGHTSSVRVVDFL